VFSTNEDFPHWICFAITMELNIIQKSNSMGRDDGQVLKDLYQWLQDVWFDDSWHDRRA
jgi:hypothetical protein